MYLQPARVNAARPHFTTTVPALGPPPVPWRSTARQPRAACADHNPRHPRRPHAQARQSGDKLCDLAFHKQTFRGSL